jgi:hypothetical protein
LVTRSPLNILHFYETRSTNSGFNQVSDLLTRNIL